MGTTFWCLIFRKLRWDHGEARSRCCRSCRTAMTRLPGSPCRALRMIWVYIPFTWSTKFSSSCCFCCLHLQSLLICIGCWMWIVGRKSHHFISVQSWCSVSSRNLIISCTQKFSSYITKLSYQIDKQTGIRTPHALLMWWYWFLLPYHLLRLPWSNYEYAPTRLPWNMTILFTFRIFRLSCPKSGWNLLFKQCAYYPILFMHKWCLIM